MSKFILWSPFIKENSLTFLATPTFIHRINKGDFNMVKTMLEDMGLRNIQPESWTIQSYLCEYLRDENAANWEDVWGLTWKIKVTLVEREEQSIKLKKNELFRSSAVDKTVKPTGSPTSIRALWVLDFYASDYDSVFADHLQELKEALEEGKSKEEILDVFGDPEEEEHYYQLSDSYTSYKKTLQSTDFLTVTRLADKRLWIDLGNVNYSFFLERHPFLEALKAIAKIFNATSSWDDFVYYQVK